MFNQIWKQAVVFQQQMDGYISDAHRYYSAIKKGTVMPVGKTCMEFDVIVLGEESGRQLLDGFIPMWNINY